MGKIARWISKQENSVEQKVLKRTRSNYPTKEICLLCGVNLENSKIDKRKSLGKKDFSRFVD